MDKPELSVNMTGSLWNKKFFGQYTYAYYEYIRKRRNPPHPQ